MKATLAISASLAAFAAFGNGTVEHMPRGWADASALTPERGERRASVAVVPPSMRSMTSRDNFIEVFSDEIEPEDGIGFKGPIFKSAVDSAESIAALTGLEMPRGGAGLVIHVGDGTNNDTRVVCRVERNNSGALVTRLYLPSPGYSDLDAFCRHIAAAYLRAWASRTAEAAAGERGADFKEAPEWLAHGLSRLTDESFALFDRLDALGMWQAGEMPFFPDLPSMLKFDTDTGSSLCGFMAKWMLEHKLAKEEKKGKDKKPLAKTVFAAMMERLSSAKEWDDSLLLQLLTGETDPQAQDAAFDRHMLKLRLAVLVPGKATPEDVRTFASRLLLYPPFFDISFPDGQKAMPFRFAIKHASNPVVRASAVMRLRGLELTVIGRSEKLVEAAKSYVRFLRALALREDADSLTEKLDEADALLGAAYKEAVETFGT